MDRLEIQTPPDLYVRSPGGGGFQQVEMRINGEALIDIVRRIELPYAEREFDERVAAGETAEELGERGSLAGAYLYLPRVVALPPSRNFFGKPYRHGFVTDANDPVNKKSLILQCTCGITDCWFLVVDITLGDLTVTWDHFQQFHRDWIYDTKPFVFDRAEYEAAFNFA
jgi:hypothetical protein